MPLMVHEWLLGASPESSQRRVGAESSARTSRGTRSLRELEHHRVPHTEEGRDFEDIDVDVFDPDNSRGTRMEESAL
jgi:hypothetical protein